MDFESTLGPWLGKTMKMMDYHFQETFKNSDIDLTKQQWIVLKILIKDDAKPQNELAFITNRDKASLTRLLSVMEKKNFIVRIPCETDKRINRIHVTKIGHEVFESTLPVMKLLLDRLQYQLTEEEIQSTIKVLKKIQHNLSDTLFATPIIK